MLKPLHTMVHIRILLLEESYYTMNYKPCRTAGCGTSNREEYTRGYSCTHSLAMKAYERSGERANHLSRAFKAF